MDPKQTNPTDTKKGKADAKDPIPRFGIVAAMSKNRVIGINGSIPWRAPQDRKIFKSLTMGTTLIIGRKTFEEHPNQCHIDHTRYCIIISKSLGTVDDGGSGRLHVAHSLDDALHCAKVLNERHFQPEWNAAGNRLLCWVAGGEKVYEEALRHPSAHEVHLSTVDIEIDLSEAIAKSFDIARFPAKHRWDKHFHEVRSMDYESCADPMNATQGFKYRVFERRRRS